MIRLGNTVLIAVATPGHTPGALTWHWGSCDGGVCRQIVYADSLTPSQPPTAIGSAITPLISPLIARALRRSAALDCDILLTPHPSASDMADRLRPGRRWRTATPAGITRLR